MAIANSDGSIILTTKIDQSGLKKGMSTMKSGVSSLIGSFGKLATAIGVAFSVGALVSFSKEASNLATTTEASVRRLIDIYGEASKAVGDFIDTNAQALGMSRAAAASFSSVYGNLFSVWADQATNAELTNRYLNMTAVVASKTGRTVEDVQERIRSGLLGNTEAIEDLGVFVNVKTIEMTDAFQRMANGKTWEQLDAYTQQQIRSMAILEQATAKYGIEVANTSATIRNRFNAAYQDFQNSWGTIINKILIPVLKMLTEIFNVGAMIFNAFSGESGEILENAKLQEESTDKTAKNIQEQTKNQKDLNKEMKKTLLGIDDIEILSSSTKEEDNFSLDVGSIFGESSPKETTKELSAFEKKIREIVKKIKKAFEPLEKSFNFFWDDLSKGAESIYNSALKPFGDWIVNSFAPAFSITLSKAIDSAKESFVVFKDVVSAFWNNTLSPFLKDLGDLIILLTKKTGEYFKYIGNKISENKEEITTIVEFISVAMAIIESYIMPYIERFLNIIFEIKKYVVDVVFTIISKFGNALEFIKNIILAIKELFKGNFAESGEYFKSALGNIGEAMLGMVNLFISAMNKIIYYAFETVKSVVNSITGIVEKVGGFFGADWNLKWEAKAPQIPQIPRLAQGTVVPPNKEFMAILGDNTKEHEIVSPVSTMKQAFMEAMVEMGGAGQTTREEHYYLNETQLMSIMYRLAKGGEKMRGVSLEDGGY